MKKPKNLKECFKELKESPLKELEKFEQLSERDICLYHHGCGTNLRNNWGLWRKNDLTDWFNSIDIYHADDMSGIIFTSFHRLLNRKPIEIDKQVKHYQDYWKQKGFKDGNPLNKLKDE